MKKFVAILLVFSFVFSMFPIAHAEFLTMPMDGPFKLIKIPFPDSIDDNQSWSTYARYTDTKEPIPLSMCYDDYVYATVPFEYKDREIETFIPKEIEFTDYDPSRYEFHTMEMLSKVGVIRGNDKGEAKPFDNVTRAEMVAMVMRMIGYERMPFETKVKTFDDVKKDSWYYDTIMAANFAGIIYGDSEKTFSPERNVTREEMVTMVARAIKYVGLGNKYNGVIEPVDTDKISPWAKEAYEIIRYYPSDYDDTDMENPVRVLNPQKNATRYDVAYTIFHTLSASQVYPKDVALLYCFDKGMPVIDGSTSTYPFTEAVYNALFTNGESHRSFPLKHSKSHASYERLINGEVDMLFASVYPAQDIYELAKEKGVELELIPIAYDAMIFFTNKDNPSTNLTKEQITNIYVNDAYDNWNEVGGANALLYPYCRNNDSGSHAQMEKHFLNGNEIHSEVQKETSYTMSNILTDVMASKTSDPIGYGLGYSIYYYYNNMDMFYDVHNQLKLLSIDGVMPTDETIADGSYPLSNNTYIVLRKDTPKDAPARKMAEFMLTDIGQGCVESAGFGKLKKNAEISSDMLFSDKLNIQMPVDKNYMFSPLSVKMALALLANGASGDTKTEILNSIGVTDIDEFNNYSKELIKRYCESDILKLNIANSIWINKDKTAQKFSENYKEKIIDFYDGEVKIVDSSNAVKEINSWVRKKTNEKITGIINSADFYSMLINAIYFKGAWQSEFNEGLTKPDIFNNADGTKISLDFMNKTSWISYAETKSSQMIELKYKNCVDNFNDNGDYIDSLVYDDLDVSMYFIMSDEDINVEEELVANINDKSFKSKYIKLSLPKFIIEYETTLTKMLGNIGVSSAFDPYLADFYKMFDNGNMFVTDAIHKTYINVDEKGTEAAAITAISMATSSLPPEPMELKFNKPFYFVIRDNIAGEILFMGRYVTGL